MKNDFPENDDLWNLLGKANHREASPFVARKVLRQIREVAPDSKPAWALPRWLAPAAFAVLVAGFASTLDQAPTRHPAAAMIPMSPRLWIFEGADVGQAGRPRYISEVQKGSVFCMTPELAEYFDAAARLDQVLPSVDFTPAHLAGL
jgi:hypothetical protein